MTDQVAALTAEALDAHAAGDTETAAAIFKKRDHVATRQLAAEQVDAGDFPHRPAIFDPFDAPNTGVPHASLVYKPPAPEVFVPAFAMWPSARTQTAPTATFPLAPRSPLN